MMQTFAVLLVIVGSDQCARREVILAGRIGVCFSSSVSGFSGGLPARGRFRAAALRRCAPRHANVVHSLRERWRFGG